MKHQVTLVRFGGMRRFVGTLVASAALIFALLGVISASASVTSAGRISAHLTKTSLRASEAGKVKLVYGFSSQSAGFAYGLWRKTGANWIKVRGVSTRGSLHGSHTMTVKRLFGPRPVEVGQYRLRVSDAANSVTLTFAVIKAPSPGSPRPGGSPTLPSPPGAFGKTSPSNGANGQLNTPSLSWAASSNAFSYQYCVDTTNNNTCDGSWVSTNAQTSASLTGLTLGTTYYWQVEAINAQGTAQADNAVWFAFTVAGPTAGVWLNTGVSGAYNPVVGVNFTVDPSGATVVRFVFLYDVSACGPQSAWTDTPSPIAGASFVSPDTASWRSSQLNAGGGGVFAGTFDSPTSAHGTGFFGGLCTTSSERYSFSTGTFSWTASWRSSG
jgi:hypothetical protein